MGRREGRSSQQQQQQQQKKKKMPSPLHNRQTDTLNSTSFLSSKFHSQISLSLSLSFSLENCCLVLSSSGKLKSHKLDCRHSMKIQQNCLSSKQKTLLQPADLFLSLSLPQLLLLHESFSISFFLSSHICCSCCFCYNNNNFTIITTPDARKHTHSPRPSLQQSSALFSPG